MENLRSHLKVGLVGGTLSCGCLLLAAAVDWLTGLPLHYSVFMAPIAWAVLLFASTGSRFLERRRVPLRQAPHEPWETSRATPDQTAKRRKPSHGAIIKSAVFLSRERTGAAGCSSREEGVLA